MALKRPHGIESIDIHSSNISSLTLARIKASAAFERGVNLQLKDFGALFMDESLD